MLARITRFWRQKRPTHLRLDDVGPVVDIYSGESQQAEPSVDQEILPAIVVDKALSMVSSVVLEHETSRGVVEVGPTHETTIRVVQVGLNLRSG
jgi:hypothetical protein